MPVLTKYIFGNQIDPKKTPFGLLSGQVRHNAIITSAGWYNYNGQKLGYGDLSLQDMEKISLNISKLEIFFALTEGDSFWNIPKEINSTEPGLDYIANNAAWIITKSLIIRSRPEIIKSEKTIQDGISYMRIPRGNIKEILQPSSIKEKPVLLKTDEPEPKKAVKTKSRSVAYQKIPSGSTIGLPGIIPGSVPVKKASVYKKP
jgi:hypothetical protein